MANWKALLVALDTELPINKRVVQIYVMRLKAMAAVLPTLLSKMAACIILKIASTKLK